MKVSLVWASPNPERTIAVAMRRCYSTKSIEDIQAELEQKGPQYWRYLIGKALLDKSLDVLEHFMVTLLVEGAEDADVGLLTRNFPYLRATRLREADWLITLNARTLVETWRDQQCRFFAEKVVAELNGKGVCPNFNELAFGVRVDAG